MLTVGAAHALIIALQMPTSPGERRFYVKLLETVGAPCRPGERVAALELLKRMGPKVIVVDEMHHLLAGSGREQRVALNLLKYLSNELQCCMVAVGTRTGDSSSRGPANVGPARRCGVRYDITITDHQTRH